jgi:hypothetical protein
VELACSWFCAPARDSDSEELQITPAEIYRENADLGLRCAVEGAPTRSELQRAGPRREMIMRVRWPHDAAAMNILKGQRVVMCTKMALMRGMGIASFKRSETK